MRANKKKKGVSKACKHNTNPCYPFRGANALLLISKIIMVQNVSIVKPHYIRGAYAQG